MKIGFFGGSFDPPHRGHIALARLAIERLGLDRVLLAPVGVQPLKRDRPQAGFDDRLAMTRLAIEGHPGLEVSLVDAPHPDNRPNYTLDTIRALRASLAGENRIYFLMGADSFLTIGQWHRAADLLFACDTVVAARPGFDLNRLAAALPEGITAERTAADVLTLHNAAGRTSHVCLLPDLAERASATDIREALERGESPDAMLEPQVEAYIREHNLYARRTAG
jgi:nicotinate-nucleotide adenylyltransferase